MVCFSLVKTKIQLDWSQEWEKLHQFHVWLRMSLSRCSPSSYLKKLFVSRYPIITSDPEKLEPHDLSLWLYESFCIILLYGHLVYFILKILAWEICNMKWGYAKKVIIKSQRQFLYGSNFYGSDVIMNWQSCQSKLDFNLVLLAMLYLYLID